MPLNAESQRESPSKPTRLLKLVVGTGVLLLLIYASVFTLQGGYAEVEEAVINPPTGEHVAPAIHDTQASR